MLIWGHADIHLLQILVVTSIRCIIMLVHFRHYTSEFQRQMLMVSLKEVYGWAVIIAVFILLAILVSDYRFHLGSKYGEMLRLSQIWRHVRSKIS